MLSRRSILLTCATATLTVALALQTGCTPQQTTKNTLSIGMVLEPPGLDPTAGAASAIGEVVLYNVFETLTKIQPDGSILPLLAEKWEASPDQKIWTFHLRKDAKFHNGEPFNAAAVKFSFERATGKDSTNKDKRLFASFERVETPDDFTVVLHGKEPNPDLPFLLGQATAIIVEPKSAASNNTQPVGTGPYQLGDWQKGATLALNKWDGYRAASNIALQSATFRFIGDVAAQSSALLAGDVDLFPRVQVARNMQQFKGDSRFQVLVGASRAKTIMAMNNAKKPLDDVRVRRAISAAIDRQAVIQGAADGFGVPIGSFYVPGAPGYVDTTGINAYDPEKAKALLQQAGISNLTLTMKLPPTPYAKQGGEVIAAMLAKVGITAKIESVEWAQWLSNVYGKKDYDLTIISHVEPFDFGNFAKPDYYWNYRSPAFNSLYDNILQTGDTQQRERLLGDAQKLVADDAVAVYLYQPQWITVGNGKLAGVWKDMPVFVNDLSALRWQ
ncbi:MAG: ABC transporter substrate-binding protein [Brachymonas sp.]|nr:ABC transporter substrate-binding protein [Brachymonas sp.]